MKCFGYIRVSSKQKQTSGLSLAEQEASIREFASREGFDVVSVHEEKASGAKDDRPVLNELLKRAKQEGAHIICSRLDRLSRSVSFIASLMDDGVPFITVEFGTNASPFMLHIWAAVAQQHRQYIAERTREALKRKKLRDSNWKAGNPHWKKTIDRAWSAKRTKADARALALAPVIDELRKAGIITQTGMTEALNARGVPTATGKTWQQPTVRLLLKRLERIQNDE